MKSTIRTKMILTILPIVIASIAIVGTTSLFTARAGMMRLATRALAFKAEILKQYCDSQWELLVSQGFSTDPEFLQAARNAVKARSVSLLRQGSERVCAIEVGGKLALSVSLDDSVDGKPAPAELVENMERGVTGAFSFGDEPGLRYGQAFFFAPFGWYVVVSDSADSIFEESNHITTILLEALVVSVFVAGLLLLILATSIARPVGRVSRAMTEIIRTKDFAQRIEPESRDELGVLAVQFNALCRELDLSYTRISEIAASEVRARLEVVERETEALIALGQAAEFRDAGTGSHIVRVGLYTKILAARFFADEDERRIVYYAAPLHDLGKIGIPDSILLKPGPLEPAELELMKTHAEIGHSILKEFKNPSLARGAIIALTHHERYDGSGYPRGLAGADIPICGRLLAAIDVFDALTSVRPYKGAWPVDRAFEYLVSERGRQFDPAVVDAFLELRREITEIHDLHRGGA